MKTTTFDQLKSMLKSMSLSIFPRLRNMEKNIDEIKSTLPTPEKEIIFTKGADGQYTCNIPHAELWEMDAETIGKNARIVIGNDVYGVRGASKKDNPPLYRNVIQVSADLNVGKYDLTDLYHKTLILSYFLSGMDGTTTMIIPDEVSSLSNRHDGDVSLFNIPVLESNGVWRNAPADFLVQDGSRSVYTLKTMSETTKGGAKLGKGLKMDGDTLNVDDGEYELIEKIIIGYELLTAKPDDWESNWTAYYRNTGTAVEPVYELITDASAPTWAPNTYYAYTGEGAVFKRTEKETDEKPFRFTKLRVRFESQGATSAAGFSYFYGYYTHGNFILARIWHAESKNTSGGTIRRINEIELKNNYWISRWMDWTTQVSGALTEYIDAKYLEFPNIRKPYVNVVDIRQTLAAGTIIEIWGVRYNA